MFADEILPAQGLFHGLGKDELRGIGLRAVERRYAPGEPALREDQVSPGIFFILEGRFRVTKTGADRKKIVTLARLGPGEFFGEIEFLDGSPAHATVTAESEARVAFFDSHQFLELQNTNPQSFIVIVLNLARVLGKRLREKGDELLRS